jgi:hypothetical protein
MDIQRSLIGLGLVILLIGVMWPIFSWIGLGRLPGDIMFQRGGNTFYFPLVTCIIVSLALSVVFWLFNR